VKRIRPPSGGSSDLSGRGQVHKKQDIVTYYDDNKLNMNLLGIDLGSSSVKASVLDGESGECIASAFMPKTEMEMIAVRPGWAEQDPSVWWNNLKAAITECISKIDSKKESIGAIGISYQMHGLVTVGKDLKPLRPSIIWCDSRAVDYGNRAMKSLGKEFVLSHLLNSPGNFTAAKLAWVKENEKEIYNRIYKIMLPGDYIAMILTGEIKTSFTGMSEGIFWDFSNEKVSPELLDYFGFDQSMFPGQIPSFSVQGSLVKKIADELGLPEGIPVAYRAGDQPNNAFSLNVLEPGEIAATAGTSGVIYGVTDQKRYDPESRVNTFLHVNHGKGKTRLGVLLCINGTGILNSWMKRNTGGNISYEEMNIKASAIKPGSEGVMILPFGNGSERILLNRDPGARIAGLNFNLHTSAHLFRASQEGIAFSFRYGLDIMKQTGIQASVMRAGMANMFLSPVFREAVSCITGTTIDLFNTDGSLGAARGAGIGCGYFRSEKEAFIGLRSVGSTEPDKSKVVQYEESYARWCNLLDSSLT
jgi:xylulokinase